jgi:putative ABC transport system permease protein
MKTLRLDVRHALRVLGRNPGATATAIFTLALAIGAATAIFSVVHGVLLRPLPYPAPDQLVAVWEVNTRGTYARLADPNFTDFRDRSHAFAAMAKYTGMTTPVVGPGEPTRETVTLVSRDFFTVLGVPPALGRGLIAGDARMGAEPVAVVSHRYWSESLRSARDLSSAHLHIQNASFAVVGVMPPGFDFPAGTGIWVPAELEPANTSRTSHNYYGIGRLRDGVSVAAATADLGAIAREIIQQAPEQGEYLMTDAVAVPLQASLTRRVGSTLYLLLGAVFFLVLVACANVTNLLLAQAMARQRELAIRQALGAGRGRLVRQFLVETMLLLAVSCLLGLIVASVATSLLLAVAPPDLPRLDEVSISGTVLAFAFGLSTLVALGIGVLTAVRASHRDPREALADGARGQAGSAAGRRAGRVLVAAQMAMTVVLLTGAALLGRSLLEVLSIDPGFRTDDVVAMDVALPYSEDPGAAARLSTFYTTLLDRLRPIPGVERVAATTGVPLEGRPDGLFALLSAQETPATSDDLRALFARKERLGTADYAAVTPDYFRTLGIPVVRGRAFDDRDTAAAPHAAVISETLARTRWPGADPLGERIEFGNMDGDLRPLTIVGVVADTRESGLEQPPRPAIYVNLLQRPRFSVTVVMQASGDRGATVRASRDVLKALAPDVPPRFRTFAEIYAAALGPRRFSMLLVGVFAGTALILAIAGVYGVMTYDVAGRRRELGVRIALGATRGQLLRLVLAHGLLTAAAGVAVGVVAAFALAGTLESLLFGITPTDPLTFGVVIAALMGVAAMACYLPARRATDADPMEALRLE